MGLPGVCEALMDHYGPQGWWPARGRFEMAVGAILVQNTRWRNAALAIDGLRRRGWLTPGALAGAPIEVLQATIRPAGFWRQKARRIRDFSAWLEASGGFGRLARLDTGALRTRLLETPGVGPETADCILVYAFGRPVFIADAYARRLFRRLALPGSTGLPERYEAVRRWAESVLPADAGLMNEFHALIVAHGKAHCSAEPRCEGCVLRARCPTGQRPGQPPGRRLTGRRSSSR